MRLFLLLREEQCRAVNARILGEFRLLEVDGEFLGALEIKAVKSLFDAGEKFVAEVGQAAADDIAVDVENLIEVEIQQAEVFANLVKRPGRHRIPFLIGRLDDLPGNLPACLLYTSRCV